MSIPFYVVAPTTAKVQKASFTKEKQHLLLAVKNSLIPTSEKFLVFESAGDYALSFGKDETYNALIKYFGFLSKSATSPEKVVIMRWYDLDTKPFILGSSVDLKNGLAKLKQIEDGSLTVKFDGSSYECSGLDFSGANSFSDVATTLQTAIRGNVGGGTIFTDATVEFNSIANALVITTGEAGKEHSVDNCTGDCLEELGFRVQHLSQGVDAEFFTDFLDRVLDANPACFSISTNETLTNQDMIDACEWLQQIISNQTMNTRYKLVFNFDDKVNLKEVSDEIKAKSYTGITLTYDPNGEKVNILDCAITASTDYDAENSTKNYNFQPATGYTSLTNFGTVDSFQAGETNKGLYDELNNLGACFVYSIGFGVQEQTYYGTGIMLGAFGTEDIQANQAGLELDLQLAIVNALSAIEKVKLQGTDADDMISSMVNPSFIKFQKNGAIARNGTLSDTDRISITNAFGSPDSADCVAENGYYFRVETLNTTDVANRQRRVKYAYLAGGVVNKVVFSANIYGA